MFVQGYERGFEVVFQPPRKRLQLLGRWHQFRRYPFCNDGGGHWQQFLVFQKILWLVVVVLIVEFFLPQPKEVVMAFGKPTRDLLVSGEAPQILKVAIFSLFIVFSNNPLWLLIVRGYDKLNRGFWVSSSGFPWRH